MVAAVFLNGVLNRRPQFSPLCRHICRSLQHESPSFLAARSSPWGSGGAGVGRPPLAPLRTVTARAQPCGSAVRPAQWRQLVFYFSAFHLVRQRPCSPTSAPRTVPLSNVVDRRSTRKSRSFRAFFLASAGSKFLAFILSSSAFSRSLCGPRSRPRLPVPDDLDGRDRPALGLRSRPDRVLSLFAVRAFRELSSIGNHHAVYQRWACQLTDANRITLAETLLPRWTRRGRPAPPESSPCLFFMSIVLPSSCSGSAGGPGRRRGVAWSPTSDCSAAALAWLFPDLCLNRLYLNLLP